MRAERTLFSVHALRGVASVFVVLYHATQIIEHFYQIRPFHGFFMFGFSGVHIFFVLSGFIVYYVHSRDAGYPREYLPFLVKRFVRIYPMYWLILLSYSVFLLLNERIKVAAIVQNMFLLKAPAIGIIAVSWTLYYEVFFYFLFSLLILSKRIGYSMICLWGMGIFMVAAFNVHIPFAYFHKFSALILIGFGASVLAKKIGILERKDKFSALSFFTGVILFGFTAAYCYVRNIINWDLWSVTLGFGLASGLLMMAVFSNSFESFFKGQKTLNLLGTASYTTFLLHYPILWESIGYLKAHILPDLKNELIASSLCLLISGLTLLVGYVLSVKIEYPLISYLRGHLLRRVS
jgi:peptidoglycan/LPS O-acetylase OafA/YrhL